MNPIDGKDNENLLIWVIEPGEEFYMNMYLWRTIPYSFTLEADVDEIDLTVKKIVTVRDVECNSEESYDYIGMTEF